MRLKEARGGFAGRPKKLVPPPDALPGPHVHLALLKLEDVEAARRYAELEYARAVESEETLDAIVHEINGAFQDYANAAACVLARPKPQACSEWCASLSAAARSMGAGLGSSQICTGMTPAGFRAIKILEQGISGRGVELLPEDRDMLKALFLAGLPHHLIPEDVSLSDAALRWCLSSAIGYFHPLLSALDLIAERAATGWQAQIHKGSPRDEASQHLFSELVRLYRTLFGKWPATTWRSPGHRWVFKLIKCAESRAGSPTYIKGKTPRINASADQPVPRLPVLAQLGGEINPLKHSSGRQSAVEHRLRQAVSRARALEESGSQT